MFILKLCILLNPLAVVKLGSSLVNEGSLVSSLPEKLHLLFAPGSVFQSGGGATTKKVTSWKKKKGSPTKGNLKSKIYTIYRHC